MRERIAIWSILMPSKRHRYVTESDAIGTFIWDEVISAFSRLFRSRDSIPFLTSSFAFLFAIILSPRHFLFFTDTAADGASAAVRAAEGRCGQTPCWTVIFFTLSTFYRMELSGATPSPSWLRQFSLLFHVSTSDFAPSPSWPRQVSFLFYIRFAISLFHAFPPPPLRDRGRRLHVEEEEEEEEEEERRKSAENAAGAAEKRRGWTPRRPSPYSKWMEKFFFSALTNAEAYHHSFQIFFPRDLLQFSISRFHAISRVSRASPWRIGDYDSPAASSRSFPRFLFRLHATSLGPRQFFFVLLF